MIEQRDFNAGWIPSDDSYNGRKNGLFQMDNLNLDENGIVSLVRGATKISSALASVPHSLFSRYIGSTFYRYAACANGSIYRDTNKAGTFATTRITGGSASRASFAAALNQIFIVSGNKYKKDDGTNLYDIGIAAPSAPGVTLITSPSQIDLQNLDGSGHYTNWLVDIGTLTQNTSDYITMQSDATSFQSVIRTVFSSVKDMTTYSNGGTGLDSDIVFFYLSFIDQTQVQSVSIKFHTVDPTSTPGAGSIDDAYYTFTWTAVNTPNSFASNVFNFFGARRKDFTLTGDPTQKFWDKIKAVTLTVICNSSIELKFDELVIQGGSKAALLGSYKYYAQSVYNTGIYQALSPISVASVIPTLNNGRVTISNSAPADASVTALNIYRININTQAVPTLLKTIASPWSDFDDGLSDEALLASSGVTANFFLTSVQSISEAILDIVGLYFGRMLYFTTSQVYISDLLDPDAYDSRYVLKYSGNTSETFLWAKKISNSLIYIGTNYDIYQLSGTLTPLPDGTLDAIIRPLGVNYPPVSRAVAVESGSVVYMANDGWRLLGAYGDDSTNLSGNLDLLFKGFTRYGTPNIIPGYDDTSASRCTLNKNKFFTIVTLSDATLRLLIYDVQRKYWYPCLQNPTSLFTEEDGVLIGGFADSFIRQLDTPSNLLVDGVAQQINFLSPIFDGSSAATIALAAASGKNRKDTFTLKIRCDTGNTALTLTVYKDEVAQTAISLAANGNTEVQLNAHAFTLGKNYQFKITGTTSVFKLFYISLEYTERPSQLKYLRLAPENLGSISRKRAIMAPPLVIDTLGNDVIYSATIDGNSVAVANPTINTTDKTTYTPYFASEELGVDFGATLSGGPFEFYGVNPQDWISEKLPPRAEFLIVTENNDGKVSKKRRRTLPFVIYTFGQNVSVTPIIDGVSFTVTTFNTNYKQTCIYYFTTDVMGIDYRLKIDGAGNPFEFYGIMQSEDVQIIPPGKLFDQVGPFEFLRLAIAERFRVRLLCDGTSITYTVFVEETQVYSSSFTTTANIDKTYEVVLPRGIQGTVIRIEFSSGSPFHRFSFKLKARITGGQADGKWVGQ